MRTRTAAALLSLVVAVGMAVDLVDGAADPRPRPVVVADTTAQGCSAAVCGLVCPHPPGPARPPVSQVPGRRLAWHCRHHVPKREPAPRTSAGGSPSVRSATSATAPHGKRGRASKPGPSPVATPHRAGPVGPTEPPHRRSRTGAA